MSALWGFIGGAAGLALLDAAVSSKTTQTSSGTSTEAAGDLSGAFDLANKFLAIVISPSRPGIEDHSKATTTAAATGTTATTTAATTTATAAGATTTSPTKTVGPLKL